MTRWGAHLLAHLEDQPLPEYPRPHLQRDSYLNLNGWWNYTITTTRQLPTQFEGRIRVPFSPESVLSGVQRQLNPGEVLFYQRCVTLPLGFRHDVLHLHFGAVDQYAEVYIDGQLVAKHLGGYTPFSVIIAPSLDTFEIVILVTDDSNQYGHLTGKQRLERGGIFYTPQSGIWQTVWLESTPEHYIQKLRITPRFDDHQFVLEWHHTNGENVLVQAFFDGLEVARASSKTSSAVITLDERHEWTPTTPHLYHFTLTCGTDVVHSYAGLRCIERKKDAHGLMRFYLNHQPIFQSGVLDQGYFSDGLLTPPSDAAMEYDIQLMKEMGFNMIRKHIKVEPLRWYYHCDRLGMLVWQDMISGTEFEDVKFHHALSIAKIHLPDALRCVFGRQRRSGRDEYEQCLHEMLDTLVSYTCIVTWVPFNEAWGQFDTRRICKKIHRLDPTRLIDHASGWSDQGVGDYHSRHIYFTKIAFKRRHAKRRINALTEFGGYSYPVAGHRFNPDFEFGYRKYPDQTSFEEAVATLYRAEILPQLANGLSALVYTQVSDVEDEINGWVTYDRHVVKARVELIAELNGELMKSFVEWIHS